MKSKRLAGDFTAKVQGPTALMQCLFVGHHITMKITTDLITLECKAYSSKWPATCCRRAGRGHDPLSFLTGITNHEAAMKTPSAKTWGVCDLTELEDFGSIAGRLQEALGPALCALHLCNAPASVDAGTQGSRGPASQADACECLDLR